MHKTIIIISREVSNTFRSKIRNNGWGEKNATNEFKCCKLLVLFVMI